MKITNDQKLKEFKDEMDALKKEYREREHVWIDRISSKVYYSSTLIGNIYFL